MHRPRAIRFGHIFLAIAGTLRCWTPLNPLIRDRLMRGSAYGWFNFALMLGVAASFAGWGVRHESLQWVAERVAAMAPEMRADPREFQNFSFPEPEEYRGMLLQAAGIGWLFAAATAASFFVAVRSRRSRSLRDELRVCPLAPGEILAGLHDWPILKCGAALFVASLPVVFPPRTLLSPHVPAWPPPRFEAAAAIAIPVFASCFVFYRRLLATWTAGLRSLRRNRMVAFFPFWLATPVVLGLALSSLSREGPEFPWLRFAPTASLFLIPIHLLGAAAGSRSLHRAATEGGEWHYPTGAWVWRELFAGLGRPFGPSRLWNFFRRNWVAVVALGILLAVARAAILKAYPPDPPYPPPETRFQSLDPAGFDLGTTMRAPGRALDEEGRYIPFLGDPAEIVVWDRQEERTVFRMAIRGDGGDVNIHFARDAGKFVVARALPTWSRWDSHRMSVDWREDAEIAVLDARSGAILAIWRVPYGGYVTAVSPCGKYAAGHRHYRDTPILIDLRDGTSRYLPTLGWVAAFADPSALICRSSYSHHVLRWDRLRDRAESSLSLQESGEGFAVLPLSERLAENRLIVFANRYKKPGPGTEHLQCSIELDAPLDVDCIVLANGPHSDQPEYANHGTGTPKSRFTSGTVALIEYGRRKSYDWRPQPDPATIPDTYVLRDLVADEFYLVKTDAEDWRFAQLCSPDLVGVGLEGGGVEFIPVDEIRTPERLLDRSLFRMD